MILITAILILHYHLAAAKESNKLLPSVHKGKKRSTWQRHVGNNYIHQFRKFKFRRSWTSLQDVFFDTLKPHEMNENYASSNGVKLIGKNTFLLPSILNALRKVLVVHPFKTWKLKHQI